MTVISSATCSNYGGGHRHVTSVDATHYYIDTQKLLYRRLPVKPPASFAAHGFYRHRHAPHAARVGFH